MENRLTEKIIANLSEEEILSLEELMFFNKDVPPLDNELVSKIKIKSRIKYNNINNKKKINIKKIIRNFSLVLGITISFGLVATMIIEKGYSYTSEQSELLPDTKNMSVMEHVITINDDKRYLSLQSVIWSQKDKAIFTTLEGEGPIPSEDVKVSINGNIVSSNSYCLSSGGESWRLGNVFNVDSQYQEGDKITYLLKDSDGEDITFDVELVKFESDFDYNDLGPSNVKEGIAIIGVVKEENDILDVNFTSVIEGKDAKVIKYCEELASNESESNIVLVDANGKEVAGKEVYHGNRFNNFQFDTENLVKPYKIHIPKVTLGIYDMSQKSEVIRLPLPKDEKIEIDKEIKLSGSNYIGMDNNRTVKIVDIEKIDDKSYGINIEFPKNIENNIKISTVRFSPVSNIINHKNDFIGYGEELDENNILNRIVIETTNKNERNIRFDIKPKYYIVEGNWELDIE